jgi:3-deoxy-manno-octulosonate cytidylyltransferase (CMP-KDO synthetase)
MAERPRICIAIPARLNSTRLPRKVLLDLGGKTLVQRVWERAQLVKEFVSRIVVLTESEEVLMHVQSFGGEGILTPDTIENGTQRIAYFASEQEYDFYVNLQGDDASIPARVITEFVQHLIENETDLLTLATPNSKVEDFLAPNVVKVVLSDKNKALYFSRSPVPNQDITRAERTKSVEFFSHIGIYGYSREKLLEYSSAGIGKLELAERLEQLRFLTLGSQFEVLLTDIFPNPIDVQSDVTRFLMRLRLEPNDN